MNVFSSTIFNLLTNSSGMLGRHKPGICHEWQFY